MLLIGTTNPVDHRLYLLLNLIGPLLMCLFVVSSNAMSSQRRPLSEFSAEDTIGLQAQDVRIKSVKEFIGDKGESLIQTEPFLCLVGPWKSREFWPKGHHCVAH